MSIEVRRANPTDAPAVAEMVGELLQEIMAATGAKSFRVSLPDTEARLRKWVADGTYTVLLVKRGPAAAGFLALTENRALYAGGTFGTIPELYVRPAFRSNGIGAALLADARQVALGRGWTRLEVTTPPLPQFDRTVAFYERQGFSRSGGHKMKIESS